MLHIPLHHVRPMRWKLVWHYWLMSSKRSQVRLQWWRKNADCSYSKQYLWMKIWLFFSFSYILLTKNWAEVTILFPKKFSRYCGITRFIKTKRCHYRENSLLVKMVRFYIVCICLFQVMGSRTKESTIAFNICSSEIRWLN